MNISKTTLCALTAIAVTACSGPPKKTFTFDSINTMEESLPCMIVVEQDWIGAAENNQFVNVSNDDDLQIPLTFNSKEIHIMAVPIRVDDKGVPTMVPKNAREVRDYKTTWRKVRVRDAGRQLFILERQ